MGAEDAGGRGGNLAFLALGQAFRMGSGVAINVLLMRMLGVEGFGVYGYVMTLVGLAAFGAGLGMERLLIRELARVPEQRGKLVTTGLFTTAVLSVGTACAVLGWVAVTDGRKEVVLAAGFAAAALGLQSLATVLQAAFHAARDMGPSSRGQMAGRMALVVGTLVGLAAGLGLLAVFVAQVLDALVTLVWIGWAYRTRLDAAPHRVRFADITALSRRSLPFGLNMLFGSIYLSADVLLLEHMRGDEDVGLYRGAVMLIALFPVIANTITTGFFPRLARRLGDPKGAGAELSFISRVLLAISVPAAVGGMLTAEPLMVLLGGEAFARSALPFLIMAPLLPLRFLNNGFATTLSTLNRQQDRTRGVMLAAGLNLGLNLLVIPQWGAAGAAATTLVTEVALGIWMRWRVSPLLEGFSLGPTLLRVCVPAGVMALALLGMGELHVVLQIGLGGAVYAGVGLATGAWRPADLRRLRRV